MKLCEKINEDSRKGYITPGRIDDTYFLRFVICNPSTNIEHVKMFY